MEAKLFSFHDIRSFMIVSDLGLSGNREDNENTVAW